MGLLVTAVPVVAVWRGVRGCGREPGPPSPEGRPHSGGSGGGGPGGHRRDGGFGWP
ncbi:DUF6479 family protein [Streptomyces sp. NPDC055210]